MIQLPLIEPDSCWTPPEIFPDWTKAKRIAIDTETRDPNLNEKGAGWATKNGEVIGISVAWKQAEKIVSNYFPIHHQHGGNMDRAVVLAYIKDILRSSIPKLFHNAIYDLGWLDAEGCTVVNGEIFDTQFGAALLDENRFSYRLDDIAKDWIGKQKDEKLLQEAGAAWGFKSPKTLKSNLWHLPAKHVGPYAEQDAAILLPLYDYEINLLEKDQLLPVSELEHDLIPMLIAMRKRGVRVDLDQAEQLKIKLEKQKVNMLKELKRKFSVDVQVYAAESVAKAFDSQNLTYPRTAKTNQPSFTKDFLEEHPHELPRTIRDIRKLDNTINVMLDGQILSHATNGRIHHELHPLKSNEGGTVSGRFSCSNPNLQQSSGRDDTFAPMVRGIFLPEEDGVWGAFDYSSQEPRLTLHYAALTNRTGAQEAVAKYKKDPRTDYHQMVADICNISRSHAKTINLGMAYGMGQLKLCHSLGLPTEEVTNKYTGRTAQSAGPEGKAIITAYHKNAPFISELMDYCATQANKRGWIRTIGGRLCRFEMWEPTKYEDVQTRGTWVASKEEAKEKWPDQPLRRAFTHKALNKLIQGSAADMTKLAMRAMWREGILPMHQMHEELDITIHTEQEWKIAEQCMTEAVGLEVPVIVDCEFGHTWGEASFNKLSWEQIND